MEEIFGIATYLSRCYDVLMAGDAIPWDRQRVVEALQRLQAEGADLSTTGMRRYSSLRHGIGRCFGSYRSALEAAGIDYATVRRFRQWTGEQVVESLRRRHADGRDLRSTAVIKSDQSLHDACLRYFGTYRNALAVAGVPYPDEGYQQWTHDNILQALRRLHAEGQDMAWKAVDARDPRLCAATLRHFGSYRAAMDAAGLDYEGKRWLDTWTEASVVEAIRRLRAEGADLRTIRVKSEQFSLFNAARHYFGSYKQALRAAGLEYERDVRPRQPKWTPDQILRGLREFHAKGNNPPRVPLSEANEYLAKAARREFGSVQAAVEAAGLTYYGRGGRKPGLAHWTEERVLAEVRELHDRGEDLRYGKVKEQRQPLFWAAKQLFGSYVNAVRQAGIDYTAMAQAHLARARLAKSGCREGAEG